jgi:hypothetical protein
MLNNATTLEQVGEIASGDVHLRFPPELRKNIQIALKLEQSTDSIAHFIKTAAYEKMQSVFQSHNLPAPQIKFRKRGKQPKRNKNTA